jgi:hypothetical protein
MSKTKPNVSTRGRVSLEKQQAAETNASSAKTRGLKKLRKYGLNSRPTPKAVPTVLSKAVPVPAPKTRDANDTIIWDLPVDPAEIRHPKGKETTKAKIAPKTKIEAKTRSSIGTVVNQTTSANKKQETARKRQFAPAAVFQPGLALRSKRKAAQAANSKLQEADSSGDEAGNDIIVPKNDGSSKRSIKEISAESKVAERVGAAKLRRMERGLPEQLVVRSKSKIGTQNEKTHRMPKGEIKRNVDVPGLLTFNSEDPEVIPSPENFEKQFQLQKQNAIALGLLDDDSGFIQDMPVSVSLNSPEIGNESRGGTLRLAQKLSTILEGIDNAGQPEITDQQSNLAEIQGLSPFGSGNGLESSSLLDLTHSWNFSAGERDVNGILEPLCHGEVERGSAGVESGRIAPEENWRKDVKKLQLKDVDAPDAFLAKAKPTVVSKFADEGGFLEPISIQEKQAQKGPSNKQGLADLAQEEGANINLPLGLVPRPEGFHPQSPSPPRDDLSAPTFSAIRRKRLLPQKPQTPPSRSPRLLKRAKGPSIIPETALANTSKPNVTLVDEHLARKTPLVEFSIGGAQNQGYSSNKKASVTQVRMTGKSLPLPEPVKKTGERQQKRKRIDGDIPNIDEGEQPGPKIQKIRKAFPSSDSIPVQQIPRLGSQSSRVDPNGSPRALNSITDIERRLKFREITRKLVKNLPLKNANAFDELTVKIDFANNGPAVFEDEPVLLWSNAKSFPLPPLAEGGGITRYVPHKKTVRGDYVEVATQGIVPIQQITTDPFLKKASERNPSEFIRRLQAGRSAQISKPPPISNSLKGSTTGNFSDLERTLVDEHSQEELSSPGDMTSESSDRSQDSRQPSGRINFDINDSALVEWVKALKPHYKGMRETLIRIVDVCNIPLQHDKTLLTLFELQDIVRNLIDQEPAIDNVLEDYHQGGTKLVEQLMSKQKGYIRCTEDEVHSIMAEMARIYNELQREISQGVKKMRTSSVDHMEKRWRQQQQTLQTLVEEGRKKIKNL